MQYVTLNDGNKMPQLGFGIFQVPDLSVAEQAVTDALDTGYRLIDTAAAYGNEERSGPPSRRAALTVTTSSSPLICGLTTSPTKRPSKGSMIH